MDIFEDLKSKVGCPFISDLKFDPYVVPAKSLLGVLDLSCYSLQSLNDAAGYFYDKSVSFASVEDAQWFFRSNT